MSFIMYKMKIQLSQISPGEERRQGELNELRSWVKLFIPGQWNPKDFKLISNNLPRVALTHSGLIYYLHAR